MAAAPAEGGKEDAVGSAMEPAGRAEGEGGEVPEGRSREEEEEGIARAEEAQKLVEARRTLRRSNLQAQPMDAASLRGLDSSIKRNTAVVKKLRQLSEEQREALLEELQAVNLSKYTSEAVTSICDAKLKSADINAAVQICSLLHQRYRDFGPSLTASLAKAFAPPPSGKAAASLAAAEDLLDGGTGGSTTARAMRKRSTLRLLCELYLCGVFEDAGVVVGVVKEVGNAEQLSKKDREAAHASITLVLTFVRYGRPMLGLPVTAADAEVYADLSITTEQKRQLMKIVTAFYDASVALLHSEHEALVDQDRTIARLLAVRGELAEEVSSAYERLRKSYDQLLRSVTSLAEALDKEPPEMPEDDHLTRMSGGAEGGGGVTGTREVPPGDPLWDDEDTRAFYESLPDLRAFVPAVLLGEPEPAKGTDHQKGKEEPGTEQGTQKGAGSGTEGGAKGEGEEAAEEEKEKETEKGVEEKGKGAEAASLETLLQRLTLCVSRDLADQFSVDFCYLNSKSSRRKLLRALFAAPRTMLELLPYYARIVATLGACMKDIPPALIQQLEEEFFSLMARKDQINIESKIRNIRFLGELCKFRLASSSLIFGILKACLDDFSHHSIDVACALLETCGRFLMRSPETSVRMGNMLDTMMRLKNAKNLDARQATLVDNAYFQCRPPERSARIVKDRPPLHQYIRKLLYVDLERNSIEKVLRQLRRLPWRECAPTVLRSVMRAHRGRYAHVHLLASLAAGLSRYHDSFAVAVVDQVLEEVRAGLESAEYGNEQRRIAILRLLGELYNYRLVDSPIVFDTLYLILYYGYGTEEQEILDPLDDCFRIRLIITLLETCGQFFDRGSSKRRLDRFLLHFQRYVLTKPNVPLDIEFDLQDLFAELRPKMVRFSTFEEAQAAIAKVEEEEQNAETLKIQKSQEGKVPPPAAGNAASQVVEPSQQPAGGNLSEDKASVQKGTTAGEEGDSGSDDESGGSVEGHDDDEEQEEDKEGEEREGGPEEEEEGEGEGEGENDGAGALSAEDDQVKLTQQRAVEVDPEEEASFEKELRALMQESLAERKLEKRPNPNLNMSIPMTLLETPRGTAGEPSSPEGGNGMGEEGVVGSTRQVALRLILKKGDKKPVARQIFVPADSSLAQASRRKEEQEAQEKQDIKRRVLAFNEREEEENRGASPQLPPANRSLSPGSLFSGGGRLRPGSRGREGGGREGGREGGGGRTGAGSRQRRPVAAGLERRR